ncbi:MAG: prephenate dehydrogenase [Cyclobacteriaceae bacterium]
MKIAVIGVGLIGGSLAIDIRARGLAKEIIGVDFNPFHQQEALRLGLVDRIMELPNAASSVDLILLATPVSTLPDLAVQVLDLCSDTCVVMDTGSTKQQVCRAVSGHAKRSQFVAAHPIAGTENSGPEAAIPGLFNGKTNIICEREKSAAVAIERAMELFNSFGMKTIFMEPLEHDRHAAYVSHLSHVSSFLLGQTVLDMEKDEKNIFNLAGSGFASTVRLAKSSPQMWAPIFEQNVEFLSQALLEYIMNLQRFHYHLMKRDTTELLRIMSQANDIRRVLDGIELKQSSVRNSETSKDVTTKIQ